MENSIGAKSSLQKSSSRTAFNYRNLLDALPFLLPALIFYGTFILYPMVTTIQLSFYKWNGYSTVAKVFIGWQNYITLFSHDPVFWTAAKNSVIWMGMSLIFPTLIGLTFAVVLNQNLAGRNIFRTVLYLPSVLAPIAVATMWRWMYNPNYGMINFLLNTLGLGVLIKPWLGDAHIAIFSVFIASTWVVAGLNMVLFLAGLQNVPKELTEAARVDGANARQVFTNVTIPVLRPTFIIVLALTIINSLKVFDLVVGMTNGGPAQATQVLALWSYYQSFGNHDFGAGNAIATVLLGITLVVVIPYLIWTSRETGE
jgi:raffinose/stachyose/melibiose transport system permease protein